jgi:hypothetical protein
MDQTARLWLFKYAKKNLWRVSRWMELEDLVQLGYESYYESRKRYPTAVNSNHIMRLFMLVFRSKIETAVEENGRQVDDARSDLVDLFDNHGKDFSRFHILVLQAPKMIADALTVMIEREEDLRKPCSVYASGRRETLNDRLTYMMGLDRKVDVVKTMRSYFGDVRDAA